MTTTLSRPPIGPATVVEKNGRAKSRRFRMYDRPGFLTYGLLTAFFLGGAFPLWWSFVMGSRQASDINAVPPVVIPGPHFIDQLLQAFATVDFG